MRSPFNVWTVALIPTLVSAFTLPSKPLAKRTTAADETHSFLELDSPNAKAIFSVPCADCGLGQADGDESLTFEFQAFLSDHPCGASNATLNGRRLAQNWNGIHAQGQGRVPTLPLPSQHLNLNLNLDLDLSWQTSCLFNGPQTEHAFSLGEDVAQVLTVTVNRIGDRELPGTHGFTLSYRPFASPELLRLSPVPVPDADKPDTAEDWRDPPTHLRIDAPATQEELSLEKHIDELHRLEDEAEILHERIREQKRIIKDHFGHHHRPSLSEEIDHCDTFSCVVSAIARKAHGVIRLVYLRFSPEHHRPHHRHHDNYAEMATTDADRFAHRPGGQAAPFRATSHPVPAEPWDEKKANIFAQAEHSLRERGPPHPVVVALEILAGVLGLSGLFALLRRLCSPRRRAERRAAAEERRREREYSRCARRQRFREWMSGRRRGRTPQDYEEKRSLVAEQEGILEAAMQEEIRQLRAAHEVVESLVQAEEGRVSASYSRSAHNQPSQHSFPVRTSSNQQLGLARIDSLPDYGSDSSDPPEYQTDDDDSDVVVDGFREYTPSTTTSVWTPGSSIPDVSPRPSGETIRSIYMRV